MSTYVIGDIQGCYDELRYLLDRIQFDPLTDRILFAGDLVNRGRQSLEVLRFVKSLGSSANSVLGNHDLHLLALSENNLSHARGNYLDGILQAHDRDELLDWLRRRPVMLSETKYRFHIIHAGLPPQWDIQTAASCARELENTLRGDQYHDFCQIMYGNNPKRWDENLQGFERIRFITNCFTRLRYCTAEGKLGLKDKGAPGTQKKQYFPWFTLKNRQTRHERIVFGHWSTLGLAHHENTWSIDSGCLWGGELTALRLDDERIFQIPCNASQVPGSD